ncbi:MAG TPA: ABC transporter permease [Candidatus Dojkabacteria bacterium]|mgnify:CR=1 FL=1|nr:ABC transporter permease [Candidatus Dojkabacteria bacterium]
MEKKDNTNVKMTVIEANKSGKYYWRDLWTYRELFIFLAWRDILVRYKQTIIGVAWSILRPVITMIVLTVIFGRLAGLPSENIPYPILVYSALLPWNFFANSFSEGSNSLIANSNMLSKIYFPRIIVPTSTIVVNIIDTAIAFLILFVLMIYYNYFPNINIIFMPLFFIIALVTTLGASYFISALNVKYRDFRFVVPFIVQFGLYISPVGFASTNIPENFRLLYYLNPMAGVIDGFRWSLLRTDQELFIPGIALAILMSLVIFTIGLSYFRKTEKEFADVI